MPKRYLLGLDVAQMLDFMAVVLLEPLKVGGVMLYDIRQLFRFPRHVPYPVMTARLCAKLHEHRLMAEVLVVMDVTGIGRAVYDPLVERGLTVVPVTITSGVEASRHGQEWHVPKTVLVRDAVRVLQERRLHGDPAMPFAAELIEELHTYEARQSQGGHVRYGAFVAGAHDDLTTATALALWRGEHPPPVAGTWGPRLPRWQTGPTPGSGHTLPDLDPWLR